MSDLLPHEGFARLLDVSGSVISSMAKGATSAGSIQSRTSERSARPATGSSGASGISREIAGLADLDADALRLRWRAATGRQAPLHLPRHVLLRMLAYRIQVDAHGGVDPAIEKFLDRLSRGLDRRTADSRDDSGGDANARPDEAVGASTRGTRQAPAIPPPVGHGSIKPGTILVREHGGMIHRVMATGDGFAWNGTTYASLSKVAKAITGVNWSGPRFFGLLAKRGDGTGNNDAGEPRDAPSKLRLSNRLTTEGHGP